MKTLETERLLLRSWRGVDFDDYYEFASHPDVGPNAGWAPHFHREISYQILQRYVEDDDTWAIALKDGGKVIGNIGLHPDPIRPYEGVNMLGYALNPAFWGNGYMTEAVGAVIEFFFEEEKMDLLCVYHYEFNERSKRVIKKSGFVPEGVLRRGIAMHNRAVVNRFCYSMTAEEYYQRKRLNEMRDF